MPRFYIEAPLEVGQELALPSAVVQHLNVLRRKENDSITLFNGDGCSFAAQIMVLQRKSCQVLITKQTLLNPINKKITLGLSIIANDKMDLALRGGTEMGAANIVPIITKYSQKVPTLRLENRLEHWQKVIISSCEQCGQNNIPTLEKPILFDSFIKNSAPHKFILSLDKNQDLTLEALAKLNDITLLIGPEGGFTAEEVELAINNAYKPIKPWSNILRAETAVVASMALFLNNLS